MQSKLPKPDTKAVYLIAAAGVLPALTVEYEGEVAGSDIRWNNSMGKIKIVATDDKTNRILASCHIGQFTGNCGAKYIAHLHLSAPEPKARKALLQIIESWAYHKTNCGFIVGSDTTYPGEGQTIKHIKQDGEKYQVLPEVPNPNWNHKTSLFWKDITKQQHVNHWASGKETRL